MFARIEPRLQAAKYVRALMSDLPKRNGWTIAEWAGDHSPDATQRLLNRASWDTAGAMSIVRRFAVARLDTAAPPAALKVGALDETGQEKKGTATAGVKRRHMGCAGGVDNGINTVHLAYIRAGAGHALIASRQWIPAEQISDPITAITTGPPLNLAFATKGELAIDLLRDAYTDGVRLDFVAGDEVYGACTKLRAFLEEQQQAYVLRIRATFTLTLGGGTCLTCTQAVTKHLRQKRKWTIRSAGDGSKGERTYAWAWIATASPAHYLLIRKHRTTGELAFHYCFVPDEQPVTLPRLISAAGLRWPVEESFEFGKDLFGLDQAQVRLYEAIRRHTVLVMAALAICAAGAAAARRRTDTQAPPPTSPDQASPEDPGMIPLTIAEIKNLVNATTTRTPSLGHATEMLEHALRSDVTPQIAWGHFFVARALLQLGRLDDAVVSVSRAAEMFKASSDILAYCQALGMAGECLRHAGRHAEALDRYLEMCDLAWSEVKPSIAALTRPNALAGAGLCLSLLGRRAEAITAFTEAADLFEQLSPSGSQDRCLMRFAEVLAAEGRSGESRTAYLRAAEVFEVIGEAEAAGHCRDRAAVP
ncbi:hypothetical protein GCM10023075_71100 [Streptosporangium album]